MEILFWVTVGGFVTVFLAQVRFRHAHPTFFRGLFVGSVFGVMGFYAGLTYIQYLVWRVSEFTQLFLPPHQPITYLFGFHATRFLMYYGVALAVALFLIWFASHGNRRFGERFFWPEEPWIGALAIFLLGNREWFSGFSWILYSFGLVGVYMLLQLALLVWKRGQVRVPLYWLWMPVAILTIIMVELI
jgi:hypothetical protein